MALDQRLILGGQTVDVGSVIGSALQNAARIQGLQQNRAIAPLQQQLMQQQIAGGETDLASQAVELQQQKFVNLANQSKLALNAFDNKDTAGVLNAINNAFPTDPKQRQEAIELLQNDPAMFRRRVEGISQALTAQKPQNFQFGSSLTVRDSQGNEYTQTQRRNPATGSVDSVLTPIGRAPAQPVGGIEIVGSTGETPAERAARESSATQETAREARKTKAIDVAVKKGAEAFDRIEPIQTSIANYDEAITAINQGAETGAIDRFLPSIKESSVRLDNVVKRLGLDVVGSTTFGALSEKELDFAVDAAIPRNLQPQELKTWLEAKKISQQKVLERVQRAASFLSSGDKTLKDWLEYDRAAQIVDESRIKKAGVDGNSKPLGEPQTQSTSGGFKILSVE